MKKIITLFSLVAICGLSLKAQESTGKHEIRVSVADGSTINLAAGFSDVFASALTGGLPSNLKRERKGTISMEAGYRYQVSNRITVGADIAYQRLEFFNKDINSNVKSDILKANIIQILPTMTYSYFRTDLINLYGSVSTGALVDLSKTNQGGRFSFAFQANPIALKIGKKIGGFVELGVGSRGIATGGLFYKF